MGRYVGFLVVAVVLVVLSTQPERTLSEPERGDPGSDPSESAFVPGRILVKPKENAPADIVETLNHKNGASIEARIPHLRVSVIDLPKGLPVADAVRRYENSPDIEYVEPDYLLYPAATPNDRYYPKMYNLNNTGQYGGSVDADIDAPQAWSVTRGSARTVVAVIDTGMDIFHPDLKHNIWTNPDEIPGNNKDDDRNGYKDDVHGWDFVHNDATVYDAKDGEVHATHIAGTIAAEGNNDIGVTGVNWHAKIMPLKFINGDDYGTASDAAAALDYAITEGVEISNNSYGFYDKCGGCYAQVLLDAIQRANAADHLFITAAMNGGADGVGDNIDNKPVYPASYDISNIISVAASNERDNLTSFSNYGVKSVDLAAPGIDILSTWPNNSYEYGYGTSMATPHVTGTAALIKSRFPGLKDTEIKARILQSVDKRANLQGKLVSGGRLNAARALGLRVR